MDFLDSRIWTPICTKLLEEYYQPRFLNLMQLSRYLISIMFRKSLTPIFCFFFYEYALKKIKTYTKS